MKRYIVIEYDPDKVVEDETGYDLLEQVVDTFDNAKLRCRVTEYKTRKAVREDKRWWK